MRSNYLIIGGAPKSATTSLFHYLTDHPAVCGSNRKETYFFAREFDQKGICDVDESRQAFDLYFSHCVAGQTWRVEATPYTLYSPGAAQKIAETLPNTKMLFILRDPVERLQSDYYMHVQRGHPSAEGGIEKFIDWQLEMGESVWSLLAMGCYAKYLQSFFEALGRERVLIHFFELVRADPRGEMQRLCASLGISSEPYADYDFRVHNRAVNVRSARLTRLQVMLEKASSEARARVMSYSTLSKGFEGLVNAGKKAMRKLNDRGFEGNQTFTPDVRAFLLGYYQPWNERLAKEIGCTLPWRWAGDED